LTAFLGAQSYIKTTEASLIVISQSSYSSKTNYQIYEVIKEEFFLKNSMF